MEHVARVLASPLKGVYSTHIDSAQQFGRHWHDTYGFGFLEHGAQEWFSGRGIVRGYPGEVIATNPGEVHDGRPLGPPTRRWRIAYVDVDVMTTLTASERGAGGRVLVRDGVTLAAAAAETGFADQSHLTRVFARQFGFTPGAWRRAARLQ